MSPTSTTASFAPTQQPTSSGPSSKSNALIPGVVVGSVAGTALLIAIVWYGLRTHKNKKTGQDRGTTDQDQGVGYQQNMPEHNPKAIYGEPTASSLPPCQQQAGNQNDYISVHEAPDNSTTNTAELWQGNYKP